MREPIKTPVKKSGRAVKVKFGSPVTLSEAVTPIKKQSQKNVVEIHKKNADWITSNIEMDAVEHKDLITRNMVEMVDKAIADSEAVVK